MKDRARKFQDAAGRRGAWPRRLTGVALLLVGAAAMAGCSLSVPMNGALTDDTPTGTIKKTGPVSPFSSQMDAEDWRRARSALDTALDPQGNGASVAWANPKSGAKGSFVPLAQVYPKGDGICRSFAARVEMKDEAEKLLHASACRVNSGDWMVGQVTPVAPAKEARLRKDDALAERDTNTQLR